MSIDPLILSALINYLDGKNGTVNPDFIKSNYLTIVRLTKINGKEQIKALDGFNLAIFLLYCFYAMVHNNLRVFVFSVYVFSGKIGNRVSILCNTLATSLC